MLVVEGIEEEQKGGRDPHWVIFRFSEKVLVLVWGFQLTW
jgi:hypothetical protein